MTPRVGRISPAKRWAVVAQSEKLLSAYTREQIRGSDPSISEDVWVLLTNVLLLQANIAGAEAWRIDGGIEFSPRSLGARAVELAETARACGQHHLEQNLRRLAMQLPFVSGEDDANGENPRPPERRSGGGGGYPAPVDLTQRFWGTQGRVGFVTAGEWAGRWVFVYPDNSEEWWTVVVAPPRPPDTWGDHYIWGDNVLLDIVRGGEIGWMPWGPAEEQVEREAFGWRPLLGPHLGLLPDGRSAVERAPTLPLLVFDRRLRQTMVSTLEDPGGEQLRRIRDSKAAFDSEGHLLRMPVGATELAAIERVPGERWHPSISAVATDAERKRQRRKRWLFGVRSPSGADSRAAVDNVIRRAIEHADDRDRRNGDTRIEPDRESTIAWPVIMFDRTNAPTVAFSQAEVESLLQKKQRQNIAVAFDGRCRPLVLGVDEKAGTLVIAGKACEEGFERVARSSLVLSRRRRRFGANGMLTDGDCEMLDAVGVDELRREIIDICLRGMRR